jgi:hypothetical protein
MELVLHRASTPTTAEDEPTGIKPILSDLGKSFYAIACLTLDVFILLQLYDWFPVWSVAIVMILLLIITTIFEIWLYIVLLRRVEQKSIG